MTASTTAYTVGRGKPPQHTRFQKGQSDNPGGEPGPAGHAKMRFQRELLAALEAAPEELALSKPETSLAAIARRMALDAGAGRAAARRLVLSQLDAACASEDEAAPERNEADRFSLVQGESQGGREDSTEAAHQTERYPSPAMAQVPTAVPANLSLKGRGEIRRIARTNDGATIEGNETDPVSLVQGESQGRREDLLAAMCAAPAQMAMRTRLMTGAADMHCGPLCG